METGENPNGSRLPELYLCTKKKALHLSLWKYFKACNASYSVLVNVRHVVHIYHMFLPKGSWKTFIS